MGYTHYFTVEKSFTKEAFKAASKDCAVICEKLYVPLFGSDGDGSPIFNAHEISFNGDASCDDECEPFVFDDEQSGFAFCKTRQKPYDIAVMCCLLVLKKHLGDSLKLGSDGDDECWAPAHKAMETVLGYDVD